MQTSTDHFDTKATVSHAHQVGGLGTYYHKEVMLVLDMVEGVLTERTQQCRGAALYSSAWRLALGYDIPRGVRGAPDPPAATCSCFADFSSVLHRKKSERASIVKVMGREMKWRQRQEESQTVRLLKRSRLAPGAMMFALDAMDATT